MRFPIRKAFATLLFATSLVPVGLVAGYHFTAPDMTYEIAAVGGLWLGRAAWIALAVVAIALLAYPPFLPYVRLRFGENWRRLGTDRGPLYDGIARLRHLETHADRLQVGRMARQLGDVPLAIENLTRAYDLDPSHVSGRYQLGLLLAEVGQLADAAALLGTVVRDDEKHAFGDAMFHLGRSLFRLHQDEPALAILRRHQKLFPGSRRVHLLVGRVLADMGRREEAVAEIQLAARPAADGEHLTPEEDLARARAKVTFFRRPAPSSASADEQSQEESDK